MTYTEKAKQLLKDAGAVTSDIVVLLPPQTDAGKIFQIVLSILREAADSDELDANSSTPVASSPTIDREC